MKKTDGKFNNDKKYQAALALLETIFEQVKASPMDFYKDLVSNNTGKKNVTFRTSSALANAVEGTTEMFIYKLSSGVDPDMNNFDFNGITNSTPGTVRITVRDNFPSNYSAEQITATLLHEFLVHGYPFSFVFNAIQAGDTADDIRNIYKKSISVGSGNNATAQHKMFGAGKTEGLQEVLAFLSSNNPKGVGNQSAKLILQELEKDIQAHH